MTRLVSICCLLGILCSGCSPSGTKRPAAAPATIAVARRGVQTPPNRVELIREQHLPNVELTTHTGRKVRFYDDLVKGKVVAINFMYTKCRGACLPATAHLAQVQQMLGDRMGRDVTFLSISLDPEQDTPDSLAQYAQSHDAGPGWYFLTGKRDDIELLRRKLGAYELDPVVDADLTQHAGIVILGNEPKARWKAISALSNPVRIRQAIERTILPPNQWSTGQAVIAEVPPEKSATVGKQIEPVDLKRFSSAR